MRAVSDEQLIEWVANGDSSCLGTLFERYHRGVYQFCLRMTRNPESADDVVQEVFMKVLKKAASFRHDGTFKGWCTNRTTGDRHSAVTPRRYSTPRDVDTVCKDRSDR